MPYISSDEQLDVFLKQFDKEYSSIYGDVFTKTMMAYVHITGEKQIPAGDPGYTGNYDPFQGHSLVKKINKWYEETYGLLAQVGNVFGERRIIVRGQLVSMIVPPIFNGNPKKFDPFKYIKELPENLISVLGEDERQDLKEKMVAFYWIGSRLALCNVCLSGAKGRSDAVQLIIGGHGDLTASVKAFSMGDPRPSLWSASQAIEKYLKGFLLDCDQTTTLASLKKNFGHGIKDLVSKASTYEPFIGNLAAYADAFDFSANDRYLPPRHNPTRALQLVDGTFVACDAIAQVLIRKHHR